MSHFSLKNKVAIVTGGNRGLGKSIALGLAEAGANIIIVSRDKEKNKEVEKEIKNKGQDCLSISADLRNVNSIYQMVDESMEHFNQIDILVNNAGVSSTNFAFDVKEEEWDKIMELNVKSLFFCSQAVGKKMKEQGHGKIINLASVAGEVGDVGISPYTASKSAVINLTRSLSLEWARYGIQVNAVGPAYIETDMNREALNNDAVHKKIVSKTPMKRLGKPEELNGAVLLLAGEGSSFITGQTIFVDGGWLAQ